MRKAKLAGMEAKIFETENLVDAEGHTVTIDEFEALRAKEIDAIGFAGQTAMSEVTLPSLNADQWNEFMDGLGKAVDLVVEDMGEDWRGDWLIEPSIGEV